MTELPDGQMWIEFFASLYDLRSRSGPARAMTQFRERSFPEVDRELIARTATNQYSASNSAYWFEHELRQYPAHVFDHDELRRHLDELVLAVGHDSQGYPCFEATWALGRSVGREPVEVPGGHLGFLARPATFAQALMQHL